MNSKNTIRTIATIKEDIDKWFDSPEGIESIKKFEIKQQIQQGWVDKIYKYLNKITKS